MKKVAKKKLIVRKKPEIYKRYYRVNDAGALESVTGYYCKELKLILSPRRGSILSNWQDAIVYNPEELFLKEEDALDKSNKTYIAYQFDDYWNGDHDIEKVWLRMIRGKMHIVSRSGYVGKGMIASQFNRKGNIFHNYADAAEKAISAHQRNIDVWNDKILKARAKVSSLKKELTRENKKKCNEHVNPWSWVAAEEERKKEEAKEKRKADKKKLLAVNGGFVTAKPEPE